MRKFRFRGLGNLTSVTSSEVIKEAEPGFELRQVDSGAYMISHYVMKPPFTLELFIKGKVGTKSSRPKKAPLGIFEQSP